MAAHHGSVETAASEGQTAVGAVGWEPAAWTCEGRKEERGGWVGKGRLCALFPAECVPLHTRARAHSSESLCFQASGCLLSSWISQMNSLKDAVRPLLPAHLQEETNCVFVVVVSLFTPQFPTRWFWIYGELETAWARNSRNHGIMDKVDVAVQLQLWSKCRLRWQVGSRRLRNEGFLCDKADFDKEPVRMRFIHLCENCAFASRRHFGCELLWIIWSSPKLKACCSRESECRIISSVFALFIYFFNFTITTFIFIQQRIQVHPKASCAFAPLSLDSFVALQKKIENWKSHLAKRFSSCADVRLIIKWCDSTLPGDHVQTRIPRSVWRRARPQRMHVSEISICL